MERQKEIWSSPALPGGGRAEATIAQARQAIIARAKALLQAFCQAAGKDAGELLIDFPLIPDWLAQLKAEMEVIDADPATLAEFQRGYQAALDGKLPGIILHLFFPPLSFF
jgi:hypothetical protein